MRLNAPPEKYDRVDQQRMRADLEAEDQRNRKRGQDIELSRGERLIIASPNGQRWSLTVNDAGSLSTEAVE